MLFDSDQRGRSPRPPSGYGLAWGLVNFGFLVWMALHVARSGIGTGQVTAILAKAALFSIPGSVLVAGLYGRRSSKGTMIGAAALETVVLAAFAASSSNNAELQALCFMEAAGIERAFSGHRV